jgi:hypothetical protein
MSRYTYRQPTVHLFGWFAAKIPPIEPVVKRQAREN